MGALGSTNSTTSIATSADLAAASGQPGSTDVAVADGGTGASTASAARTNLGLVIGTDVRAQGSGDPTRASLGLATSDSPEFAALNVGAATDTTITRSGAGDIAVEGNAIYRAGGTDVPIADGGTGASTKAAAFDALSPMTTAADLIVGGASGTGTRLAKGADGTVLTVDPTTHLLVWANPSSGFTNPMTTKGDLIVGDTGGAAIRKGVGTDTHVLTADSTAAGGVKWAAAPGAGGGAPSTADYLVGTADGGLSNEIVVGTTPGGELGGTWASPTVDAIHSGSQHSDFVAKPIAPTIYAVGTPVTGTGDVSPGHPTGHQANDIAWLVVHSSNQTVATPAGGWNRGGPAVGFGVAAAAGSMRITNFWKRDNGAESAPTVVDPGDHAIAVIIGIRGCPTVGDPFLNVGSKFKRTASTTGTASAGDTPVDNCLVMSIFGHALDSASAVFSSPTNATLSSVTEQVDTASTDGTGGGIGVITGVKTSAGGFDATTTTETSTTDVSTTVLFLPSGIAGRTGFIDRQVFITPGLADTWVKPTGASVVMVQAIGGGSSGSAGRNAATAAGGGGGAGGAYYEQMLAAAGLASTCTITTGAGGAATANTDGAASNAGSASHLTNSGTILAAGNGGSAAGVSATGSGGIGGNAGGFGVALGAGVASYTYQPAGGGTGGTTALAGGNGFGNGGGAGAGGGTTQAASGGGAAIRGGGGGGGGRSNTNVGTGGSANIGGSGLAGGATAGANGADSPFPSEYGGSGAAGGTSAAGPGGQGGWPGGGGGGGGSQAAAQRGGAGGDGIVTVTTFC